MGLFDELFGMGAPAAPGAPPAPGLGDRMMNPMTQMGLALLSNHGTLKSQRGMFDGVGEAGIRAQVYGDARREKAEAKAEKNKTLEFLRQQHPDIASLVDSGMDVGDAFTYAMRRQDMATDNARADRSFGLQQAEFGLRKDALGREQQGWNATADYLESQGADPGLVALARAGEGQTALSTFTAGKKAGASDWQELPNGDYGYFDPSTREFTKLGSAPKAPTSGGGEIVMADGTRISMGQTEGQRKNQQLYTMARPDLDVAKSNYDALGELSNQAGGALGTAGNFTTSPAYQQGIDAARNIVGSYLYSTSGATATEEEVQRNMRLVIPQPGDDKARIAIKKQRLERMVEAIGIAGGINPSATGGAGGGADLSGYSDADLERLANGG